MREKILIVEDQFIEANNLQRMLKAADYEVCGIARSVEIALNLIEKEVPDLVLLDIYLKGPQTGIDLAHILREKKIAFIYLSANSNKATLDAAKATRPYGFLVKPFREKDVLVMLEVAHYLHANSLDAIMQQKPPAVAQDSFSGIIGKSPKLQTVLEHLRIVAPVDTSVLILGESGTGKERIAECIHALSPRKSHPLVKVNCGALPSALIESILFGHEKGSFTGATERKIGKFEQAGKGTIFLDEIGELPPDVQVKLLRTLQEKEIERLGGHEVIKADVRIIAATNRDLEKEMAEGRFRMDLYYRLNVFPLYLPALRDRKEDIPLLVEHFIQHFSQKIGKAPMRVSDGFMQELIHHNWPGNIRELENTIERAVLLAQEGLIKQTSSLPAQSKTIASMEEHERNHIIDALRKCNGKIFGKNGAAELLGLKVSTLNSRIKKLGIEKSHVTPGNY